MSENLPEREIANKSGWHFKNYCYFCIWIDNKMMDKQIFDSIRRLKRELIPNERLILFGSQARGDASPDSDWDLLVLLNKEKRNFIEDSNKYAYPFTEMGLKYNVLINAKVFTEKEWKRQKPSVFYKNVEHDKIEIL